MGFRSMRKKHAADESSRHSSLRGFPWCCCTIPSIPLCCPQWFPGLKILHCQLSVKPDAVARQHTADREEQPAIMGRKA